MRPQRSLASLRRSQTLGLALGFWAVYSIIPSYSFSYDGLVHCLDIEFGSWRALIGNQNHLLYPALGKLLHLASQAAGLRLRALGVLRGFSALASAAAVGVAYGHWAERYGRAKALIAAACLGFSRALWLEAKEPDAYGLAALMACLLIGRLASRDRDPAAAGLLHGCAIWFHQMFFLAVPAFCWTFIRRRGSDGRRALARYAIALAAAAGLPYAAAGWILHGPSLSKNLFWFFGPAGAGPRNSVWANSWWSLGVWSNSAAACRGLSDGFAAAGALGYVIAPAALGLMAWATWRGSGARGRNDFVIALWLWVLAMSGFQFFWAPGTLRFRLLFLPALISLALELSPTKLGLRTLACAGLAIFGMAAANLRADVLPGSLPQNNPSLIRALWLGRTLSPRDFFLFSGYGPDSVTNVYMAYFAPQVPARSVQGYLFANPKGDMAELKGLMSQAKGRGGGVFLESALLREEAQRALERYGELPSGALKAWLAGFRTKRELVGPGGYRVYQAALAR